MLQIGNINKRWDLGRQLPEILGASFHCLAVVEAVGEKRISTQYTHKITTAAIKRRMVQAIARQPEGVQSIQHVGPVWVILQNSANI